MPRGLNYQQLGLVTFTPLTTAQRDGIADPPNYLVIFNIEAQEPQIYIFEKWHRFVTYLAGDELVMTGKIRALGDSTNEIEVRRTFKDLTATLDGATTGDLQLPPADHTHSADTDYKIEIDGAGHISVATWKWSDDDGSTWEATGLSMVDADGTPIFHELQNEIWVKFNDGGYTVGDDWTWTAIGTATQLYDLKVDTTNSQTWVGTKLLIANDANFRLQKTGGDPQFYFDSQAALVFARGVQRFGFRFGAGPTVSLAVDEDSVWLEGFFHIHQEAAAPSTPANTYARFYAKDVGGVPRPHWLDDAGTEKNMLDHGALDGLAGDDHTGYILVDGTRAFTDDLAGNLAVTGYIRAGGGSGFPYIDPTAGAPAIVFDTNDYIAYSTILDKWVHVINNVTRFSLDASNAALAVPLAMGGNKITGVTDPAAAQDAATKKYVDDNVTAGPTKEFWVYPAKIGYGPWGTPVGTFPQANLLATQYCNFSFNVPHDFASLTEAMVVLIPDATETIQADITISAVAVGEDYNSNDSTNLNEQLAVTINDMTEWDISSLFPTTTADDYVGIKFLSDTSNIHVVGLRVKYT